MRACSHTVCNVCKRVCKLLLNVLTVKLMQWQTALHIQLSLPYSSCVHEKKERKMMESPLPPTHLTSLMSVNFLLTAYKAKRTCCTLKKILFVISCSYRDSVKTRFPVVSCGVSMCCNLQVHVKAALPKVTHRLAKHTHTHTLNTHTPGFYPAFLDATVVLGGASGERSRLWSFQSC